jgi:hypothetical protein
MTQNVNPATWRTNADESLVCPHRDLSVCPACAAHPEVVEVYGVHYHVTDDADRAALALALGETP